jgi:hypothetical protein
MSRSRRHSEVESERHYVDSDDLEDSSPSHRRMSLLTLPATHTVWTDDVMSNDDGPSSPVPPAESPTAADVDRRPVRLLQSLFPHKKPTVFFDYPSYIGTLQPRCTRCVITVPGPCGRGRMHARKPPTLTGAVPFAPWVPRLGDGDSFLLMLAILHVFACAVTLQVSAVR